MSSGQRRSSSAWTRSSSMSSLRMSSMSSAPTYWRPSRSTIWLVNVVRIRPTKIPRARLYGSSDSRALVCALRTTSGRSTSSCWSTLSLIGAAGTSWKPRTACARTSAMARPPLIRAAAGDSGAVATTPGYSSLIVASTTSVSPSEGSTWSM